MPTRRYFLRNSALDSSNYFTGKTPFHRGQFGSAVGDVEPLVDGGQAKRR